MHEETLNAKRGLRGARLALALGCLGLLAMLPSAARADVDINWDGQGDLLWHNSMTNKESIHVQ